jgi:hypothetical protein
VRFVFVWQSFLIEADRTSMFQLVGISLLKSVLRCPNFANAAKLIVFRASALNDVGSKRFISGSSVRTACYNCGA